MTIGITIYHSATRKIKLSVPASSGIIASLGPITLYYSPREKWMYVIWRTGKGTDLLVPWYQKRRSRPTAKQKHLSREFPTWLVVYHDDIAVDDDTLTNTHKHSGKQASTARHFHLSRISTAHVQNLNPACRQQCSIQARVYSFLSSTEHVRKEIRNRHKCYIMFCTLSATKNGRLKHSVPETGSNVSVQLVSKFQPFLISLYLPYVAFLYFPLITITYSSHV